jgi:hypothetical protein
MKHLKFLLVTVTSFFFFFSQSAFAAYGTDDVADNTGDKTTSYGTEVEVNEFVLLDAMPDIELYYYPYSATDADAANSEDVPGGAGSVFVGGGVIKWHANVDTTLSIEDFTLTHTDTSLSERNTIEVASLGRDIGPMLALDAAAVAALTFDTTNGATVASMSADMNAAYAIRNTNHPSDDFNSDIGYTDFAAKFYLAVTLSAAGSVQAAGTYQAQVTIKAVPTVSG